MRTGKRPAHLEAPHAYKFGKAYDTPDWTASSPYTDPAVTKAIDAAAIDAIAATWGVAWSKPHPSARTLPLRNAVTTARPRPRAPTATARHPAAASAPSAAPLPPQSFPPAISEAPRGLGDTRTPRALPSSSGTAG